MICRMCGNNKWLTIYAYTKPDKYEVAMGITDVTRTWNRCTICRFYQSRRNYPIEQLEAIYNKVYRSVEFRGCTLGDSLRKELIRPYNKSENNHRCEWLRHHSTVCCDILDIGSGFGIFPYTMNRYGWRVTCTEANEDSRDFIRTNLRLQCFEKPNPKIQYSIVSIIHVLEHIQEPEMFLHDLKKNIRKKGNLFIEVPDADEFYCLPKDDDEFNSCHVYFWDLPNLYKLVSFCGYEVIDIHKFHSPERGRKRLYLLARRK